MKSTVYPAVVLTLLTLASCQHMPSQWVLSKPQALLVEESLFNGQSYPVETVNEIFGLPQQTKKELKTILAAHSGITERSTAILHYILAHTGDNFNYDLLQTRTVKETLAQRQANCLSLSILTYSIAREIGIDAVFQDIKIPEYWSSQNNQTWLSGHVNVKLRQSNRLDYITGVVQLGNDIIVDFDPNVIRQRFAAETITPARVAAMFYNNKAAESFAQKNYAQTYRYYRAAIAIDPSFALTWSNLGVLYRQQNLLLLAEQVYHHSLALDPSSANTLANLAVLYRFQGNNSAAAELEQRVHRKRQTNPWYYLMLGNEAVKRHNPDAAIGFFQQSLAINARMHEALFGLARSYFDLNNHDKAMYYLDKSRRVAKTTEDKQRYQNKISALSRVANAG